MRLGIGGNVSDNVTLEASHTMYGGIDDGVLIAGTETTLEASAFDCIKLGGTNNHLSEKDFKRVEGADVAEQMLTVAIFQINGEGELLLTLGVGAYMGGGGNASIAFNVSEFVERLFN